MSSITPAFSGACCSGRCGSCAATSHVCTRWRQCSGGGSKAAHGRRKGRERSGPAWRLPRWILHRTSHPPCARRGPGAIHAASFPPGTKRERSRCPVLLCSRPGEIAPGPARACPGHPPLLSLRSWRLLHGNFPECRHNAILAALEIQRHAAGTAACRLRRLPRGSCVDIRQMRKGVVDGGHSSRQRGGRGQNP